VLALVEHPASEIGARPAPGDGSSPESAASMGAGALPWVNVRPRRRLGPAGRRAQLVTRAPAPN